MSRAAPRSADALGRAAHAVLVVLAAREPADAAQLAATAPREPDREELTRWRGSIDAHALLTRYSDPDALARLSPRDGAPRLLFAQLEQARVDALGSRRLPGMRANLAAWHAATPPPIGADLLRAARARFGAPVMAGDAGCSSCEVTAAELIEAMAELLDDQSAFAAHALRLVAIAAQSARQAAWEAERARADSGAAAQPVAASAAGTMSDAISGDAPLEMIRASAAEPRGIPAPQRGGTLNGSRPVATSEAHTPRYRAYTRQFDQVWEACEPDAARSAALQTEQRRFVSARADFARWARRLQRHLRGRQEHAWCFDLPEGVIDAARLGRAVTAPLEPLVFKRESPMDVPLAAVTVLIDCSGSMRGLPIATAAGCADLLASVFALCRVRFEILGFTTREWHGGRSRKRWITDGRPRGPGRLTDIKHILFKDGDLPWRRTRRRLLAMLDDELLKENVDGEALLWAFERLRRRTEARRLLVVISDGAPLDECTAAVNDPGYLERHLRQVIQAIEDRSPVELMAIGIGHNVGAYYSRSLTVTGPENLGEALVQQLITLLQGRGKRRSAASGRAGGGHEPRR